MLPKIAYASLAAAMLTMSAMAAAQSQASGGGQPLPRTQTQGVSQGASGAGQQGGQHRPPPPEALAACSSGTAGSACSFSDREGKALSGTCFAPQPALPLACRPLGHPGEGGAQNSQGVPRK